jgi:hypothetical protein
VKVYKGYPGTPGRVMVERPSRIYPLPHDVRHSPTGFSWGYGGSGPSDLARCILLDAVGSDAYYMDFKFDVIAKFDMQKPFVITEYDVNVWLRQRKEMS